MAGKKSGTYMGSPLLRLALLGLACFLLFTLVIWQTKIVQKREELDQLRAKITAQETRNEEARKAVEALDTPEGLREYAERKAREDLGYAKPGERVFVDAGGSD